ncbi:MAG: hypothetical protein R2744_12010 [Bacteroidales bacterium]
MPLFRYSNSDAARAATADMERTIQKCSKVIAYPLHDRQTREEGNDPMSDKERSSPERITITVGSYLYGQGPAYPGKATKRQRSP